MASPRIKPGRTSTTGSKQYLEPSPHLPLHLATLARELVGNAGCLNSLSFRCVSICNDRELRRVETRRSGNCGSIYFGVTASCQSPAVPLNFRVLSPVLSRSAATRTSNSSVLNIDIVVQRGRYDLVRPDVNQVA